MPRASTFFHGDTPRTTVDDVELVGKVPVEHADRTDSEIALENAWSGNEFVPATSGGDDYRLVTGNDNAEFVGTPLSTYMRNLLDAVDGPAARTAFGLGTAATQNTGTSGANVPLLNGNNTVSGTWLFQLDTNANYVLEAKNVDTGTSSAAVLRTASDSASFSHLSHAVARTVARCGQTLGGWNELLSFTGSGLLVSTNNASPMKFGTNNTLALTIDTSQVATFASNVVATGEVHADGAAAALSLDRRDTGAKKWVIYSAAGSFQLYNNANGAEPLVMTDTGDLTLLGSIKSTSATAGIGYATGAGGAVTQATNKSTGVTLNKISGQITMNGAALAAAAEISFTLTNSTIAATDVVVACVGSGATAATYTVTVDAVAAGSCRITVGNYSTTSRSEPIVLNFVVIKAVAA